MSDNNVNKNNTIIDIDDKDSELKEAVDKVNAGDLVSNLQDGDSTNPESLATDESTPFIDDELRTDK